MNEDKIEKIISNVVVALFITLGVTFVLVFVLALGGAAVYLVKWIAGMLN